MTRSTVSSPARLPTISGMLMLSKAAPAALARPDMVLMTTMFWAASMDVMLSRQILRSLSATFSRVRWLDTA